MDEETFVKGHKLPVTRGVSSRESKVQQGDYQCVLSHFRHVRLCDPMDLSPPGSSVHGILQARTLERVAMPFPRGSSQSKDRTLLSTSPALAGGFSITSATWEVQFM